MERFHKNFKIIGLFLLPALLIYVAFELLPVLGSFYFSFVHWQGYQGAPMKFAGMDNFVKMFQDPLFLQSLKNIAWFVALSLVTQLPIGYCLAYLLLHIKRGRIFKAILFIPLVLPVTAIGLIWYFLLFPNETGVLNFVLIHLGLIKQPVGWLVEAKTALNSVILVTAWPSAVYYMVIGYAAMSAIPEEILESGLIDGATGFRKIVHLVIPLTWESIKISTIMIITGVLKIFDIVFVMTHGGPNGMTEVPATLMYNQAFVYNNYGMGSAIATVIFVMSITASLLSLKLMNSRQTAYS